MNINETDDYISIRSNPLQNFFKHNEMFFLLIFILFPAFLLFYNGVESIGILQHYSMRISVILLFLSIITLYKICTNKKFFQRTFQLNRSDKSCVVFTTILFRSTRREYSLHHFYSLSLTVPDDQDYTLISLEGKKSLLLGKCTFKNAEKLSRFLSIPLQFSLGNEKIIQYPFVKNESLHDIKNIICSKCGSSSNSINASKTELTCNYCQTVFRIQWK